MAFTVLGQDTYKDSNGREIAASVVQCLAPYQHIVDGFYAWECGHCGHKRSDRSCGWPISGQVVRCDKCEQMNLLVRTNCAAIDEALSGKWRSAEMEAENARLKDIERYNADQIVEIKRSVVAAAQQAIANINPRAAVQQ